MEKNNIWKIEGTEYPAGRRTRVMIGLNGAIKGERICQGYVVIYKGGGIPAHEHENIESYTILKGTGIMTVGDEKEEVHEGDYIFIPSGKSHALQNTGEGELHMMFIYSPNTIVDHWAKEKEGTLV